jgi:hypothetical protein
MAVYEFDAPFALIVNTDQYAGNFEREFCAYVTGAIGECGVGEELAEEFQEEEPSSGLFDLTSQVMDDNGCRRPVSIYDDGDKYNSIIIFFDSEPDEDDYAIIVRRAKQFAEERPDWRSYMGTKKPLKLKGMRLIRNEVVRTITTLKQFEI